MDWRATENRGLKEEVTRADAHAQGPSALAWVDGRRKALSLSLPLSLSPFSVIFIRTVRGPFGALAPESCSSWKRGKIEMIAGHEDVFIGRWQKSAFFILEKVARRTFEV